MARYIDADALLTQIQHSSGETWAKDVTRDNWSNSVQIKDNLVRLIRESPTADVVPRSDDAGIMLTFDGATGYFPKAFLIEAVRAYQKQGENEDRYIPLVDENLQRVFDSYKKHVVTELLSDLKKSIHNNAVYTSLGSVNYIPLKTFDAIIQQYVNKLKEGGHES